MDAIMELTTIAKPLEIKHIHWWLLKYEKEYKRAIEKTICGKWAKYIYKGEIPFPCSCHTRDKYCILIETYDRLNKIIDLIKKDPDLETILYEYECISMNQTAVKKWLGFYKTLYENIPFEKNLEIRMSTYPKNVISIELNPSRFKKFIEFKKIYRNVLLEDFSSPEKRYQM